MTVLIINYQCLAQHALRLFFRSIKVGFWLTGISVYFFQLYEYLHFGIIPGNPTLCSPALFCKRVFQILSTRFLGGGGCSQKLLEHHEPALKIITSVQNEIKLGVLLNFVGSQKLKHPLTHFYYCFPNGITFVHFLIQKSLCITNAISFQCILSKEKNVI